MQQQGIYTTAVGRHGVECRERVCKSRQYDEEEAEDCAENSDRIGQSIGEPFRGEPQANGCHHRQREGEEQQRSFVCGVKGYERVAAPHCQV